MNEDVNKFVDELVKQLELPGRNTSISDDLIAELKSKATVEDATAAATIKDIDPTIINDALEAVGIMDTSVESDDITALFGLGDNDIIGGLPSDYIPRESTATDFYKEGDQYRIFANLPTEDLYSLQARLIQGGLLARGAFTPGDFDTATATAISLVLGRQNRLGVNEIFVAKYQHNLQNSLQSHKDGSEFSFIISLNDSREYEGGTYFIDLKKNIKLEKGDCLVFSGQNKHRGSKILKGKRYIITGL